MSDSELDETVYAKGDKQDKQNELETLIKRVNNLEIELSKRITNQSHPSLQTLPRGFEKYFENTPHQARSSPNQAKLYNYQPYQAPTMNLGPVEGTAKTDLQDRFNVIKSSVDKIILPTNLKLHESRSGIKREDQTTLYVITKCGRYIETVFKLISQAQESEPLNIEPVITTLEANLEYLQDEFAALLVKGRFDGQTAQLFRSLQKGNSGFSSESLQNVKIAAELNSIRGNRPYQSFQSGRPYQSYQAFRPYRFSNSSYRGSSYGRPYNNWNNTNYNRYNRMPYFGRGRDSEDS